MTSPTALALSEVGASTLSTTWTQRAVDGVTGWLSRRTSRRGFLVKAGVLGAAMASDPFGYVLKPGTAYASVCGPGASCSSGWTVFCATINKGVNACPPGSIAAGWWKADGAPLCGGKARYIVDCNATCSHCSSPGTRAGICAASCWSCRCTCGPSSGCDQRKVCCNAFRYGQCNTRVRQVGAVQCRVVSCSPPWKFANCSTSPATDNRTRDHNSGQLPQGWTPITRHYHGLGDNASALGATVYGERAVAGGTAQRYQRGRMSYSAATGARETLGPIAIRYVALGAEAGVLGFPNSYPVIVGPTSHGRASSFQHGRISWASALGAFETVGAIATAFRRNGLEDGILGYPTAGQRTSADGKGRYSTFQYGRIVLTPAGIAFTASGPIGAKYIALGAEGGLLGYPTRDESAAAVTGARYTSYEHGRICWSSATAAHETHGPIWTEYVSRGAEASPLGLPVSDVVVVAAGGSRQDFQHGSLVADPAGNVTEVPAPA
jgi:LGFP repeat